MSTSLAEHVPAGEIVSISPSLPPVDCLIRHHNGEWTIHFRLHGEVALPDGRRVVINRMASLRATQQIGRKNGRKAS